MSEQNEQQNEQAPVTIIGDVAPGVQQTLQALQRAANDVVFKIGRFEVDKARLLAQLQDIETRAEQTMRAEAQRLGIEEGATWTITQDGKAVLMNKQ